MWEATKGHRREATGGFGISRLSWGWEDILQVLSLLSEKQPTKQPSVPNQGGQLPVAFLAHQAVYLHPLSSQGSLVLPYPRQEEGVWGPVETFNKHGGIQMSGENTRGLL